jgi:hypothetical protein
MKHQASVTRRVGVMLVAAAIAGGTTMSALTVAAHARILPPPTTSQTTTTPATTTPAATTPSASSKNLTNKQKEAVARKEYLGITQIPMWNAGNPAAGTLDQFSLYMRAVGLGLMASFLSVNVLTMLANGTLLSGGGAEDAWRLVLSPIVFGGAIAAWDPFFRDVVTVVNGVCTEIVDAPFAETALRNLVDKLALSSLLTERDAAVLTAGEAIGGLKLAAGLSIADFISTGNPIGWFLDFVVVLLLMVGQLIIQIERIVLFTTVAILYVTGPLALGLAAIRGLSPITAAFVRVGQAVAVIVVLWSVELVLVAVLDTGVIQPAFAVNPDAWWSSIIDSLSVLVLIFMIILTPGYVRRLLGAGGGSVTGMLRTAAVMGFAASRLFRGPQGAGGRTRQPRPVTFRNGGVNFPAPTAATGVNVPAPNGVPQMKFRAPTAPAAPAKFLQAPTAAAGPGGPAPAGSGGSSFQAPNGPAPAVSFRAPGAASGVNGAAPAAAAGANGSAPAGSGGSSFQAPNGPAPAVSFRAPGAASGVNGAAPAAAAGANGSAPAGAGGSSSQAPNGPAPAVSFQAPAAPSRVDGSDDPAAQTPTAGPEPRATPPIPAPQPAPSSADQPPSSDESSSGDTA